MEKKAAAMTDFMIWIAIFVAVLLIGLLLILKTNNPLQSAVENLFGGLL